MFSRALADLMRRDVKLNGTDEPSWITSDVFCECQEGVPKPSFAQLPSGGRSASVAVRLARTPDEPAKRLVLKLVREAGAWRVDDIVSATGSLKLALIRESAELEHSAKPSSPPAKAP